MKKVATLGFLLIVCSLSLPTENAVSDLGGSCSTIKLGDNYIPKSPEILTAVNSGYKISETKIESARALYQSSEELNVSWMRWKVLDQGDETLFYDSYVLYKSSDNGVTWSCSRISAALFQFSLGGLTKDTDYEFALTATDGITWATPIYFAGSTNLSKRPVFKLCIPEGFEPTLTSLMKDKIFISTNQPFGNDLLLNWTYSENKWKSSKTYKSPYGTSLTRIEEPIFIPFTKAAKQVDIRVVPKADKILQTYVSRGYSGYTSKGCPSLTYKIDLKKKSLVKVSQ